MPEGRNQGWHRPLAQSPEDVRPLHQMCREGRLYDVQRWIGDGKPLQLAPDAIRKGTRPKTALQIAVQTGQHSLASLLLSGGYRLELERYAPLDMVLQARRWDLFDLLLEWGADLKSVDVYTILNTYNVELYERFRAARYDLTERHEMGAALGHGTRNRPLLGFTKRYRTSDPKIQRELNIALSYHVRAGNERGVSLCLWAGADPHAPAANPESGLLEDAGPEDGEEPFIGWTAMEEAAREGHLTILKRLGPDPARDEFDDLYRVAKYESIVRFLATIQPPKDLTAILSWHFMWLEDRFPWTSRTGTATVEALLACGVRWEETNPERLSRIRRTLLKIRDDDLRRVLSRLKRPETCAPDTYQTLMRTPRMQERLLALGLVKKPISERRRDEVARLMSRHDRAALYEKLWLQPVQEVAKSSGSPGFGWGKSAASCTFQSRRGAIGHGFGWPHGAEATLAEAERGAISRGA